MSAGSLPHQGIPPAQRRAAVFAIVIAVGMA